MTWKPHLANQITKCEAKRIVVISPGDVKRRGRYSPLITELEASKCFDIYQTSEKAGQKLHALFTRKKRKIISKLHKTPNTIPEARDLKKYGKNRRTAESKTLITSLSSFEFSHVDVDQNLFAFF